ncbi:MAG: hypothetical protein JJ900_01575 [Rhodospirillales bacterium]|nr:hypothetical protein [Rhodospirillales bacterium]MBO6785511.1 hypothetical protein [Rhodospirillales bacterium]
MDFEKTTGIPNVEELAPGLKVAFEYWLEIKGERDCPKWSDFDWLRLPADTIPWCAVVDVHEDPVDFVYRFWGTARASLQHADYTGKSIKTVKPASMAEKIWDEYMEIARSGTPIHYRTTAQTDDDNDAVSYNFIRLPFGDGGRVTQILALGMHEESNIKLIQNFYGQP